MRWLRRLCIVFVVVAAVSPQAALAATPVDTARLSQGDVSLDGSAVTFEGEAIGESLNAGGEFRWVNVLADGVAIGVYVEASKLEGIDGYGDYDTNGALVEVIGVHNVACDQHGGDLDVHATAFTVVKGASQRRHALHPERAVLAVAFLGMAAALFVRGRTLRRREHL